MFVLSFLIINYIGEVNLIRDFVLLGGFNARVFALGDYWLAVTSTYLHFDLLHFALNMASLYVLGVLVANFYSSKKLFIVYTYAGIAGSILTFVAFLFLSEYENSLGASGAIYGLLGLLVGGTLKKNRFGSELPFNLRSFYPALFSSLVVSFFPNVNIFAHVGGFVTGIIAGFLFKNSMGNQESKNESKLIWLFYIVAVLITIFSFALLISKFLGF